MRWDANVEIVEIGEGKVLAYVTRRLLLLLLLQLGKRYALIWRTIGNGGHTGLELLL